MGPSAAGYDVASQMDEAARLKRVRERKTLADNHDRRDDEEAHEDLLMLSGGLNQWDQKAVQERTRLGRPLYTANGFPTMLAQITGEVRQNPPAISCVPADADASPEVAQVFEGLIRSIERLSQGQQVYVETVEASSACGRGHMRIAPVWADEESFDTELRIRSIRNVLSVKWDPAAIEFDKADANWCLVVSELDRKGFEEAYPQVNSAAWATANIAHRRLEGWRSGMSDKVTVLEEWEVKREPYKRYRMAHVAEGFGIDPRTGMEGPLPPTGEEEIIDGDPDGMIDGQLPEIFLAEMKAQGWELIQEREAYKKKICMYLWGGDKQIAGPIEWMGNRIPIFTVPGRQTHVDGQTINYGIIRHARDAQRLMNWSRSADMEAVSLSGKATPIVEEKQIEGFEDEWAIAQKQPRSHKRYKHQAGVPAPEEPSGISSNPGPNSLAQAGRFDMEDATGIHGVNMGKRAAETSGVAIEERDAQSDTGTFVFIYNLRLIVESMGRELVAAIPKYYSTREQLMILGQDDAPTVIALSQLPPLDLGKYHVIAKTGPAYATKREKAADTMMNMAKAAPPWAQPLIFMRVAKLLDIDDADEFIAEIRATGALLGQLPPDPSAMPAGAPTAPGMMPPGAPGMGPPPPGAQPPSNVIPMPRRGAPPGADPLAGVSPNSPPRAPAARTRVGPPQGASPGM